MSSYVKEVTGAHDVRRVQLTITAEDLRTSPVYVPVYIFRSHHFGASIRAVTLALPVQPGLVVVQPHGRLHVAAMSFGCRARESTCTANSRTCSWYEVWMLPIAQ